MPPESIRQSRGDTRRRRRLKALAARVACLYVLFSAFLILCLAHPLDHHSHADAGHHFDVTCVWVQKALSSHAPSTGITPPAVATILLFLLPFLWLPPQTRLIPLTGRSPPRLAFA
jgi:hypothetical protein